MKAVPKQRVSHHTIQLRWRDRLKILLTGKLYLAISRTPNALNGVKIVGAAV